MEGNKEIALEQALVAVIAAANKLGVLDEIEEKATVGLLGNDPEYRQTEHPYVTAAIEAIKQVAYNERGNS